MDGSTVATKFWHRTGDGRVQCDVCPRACRLHEGQRGFCFVRLRQQDAIVLTSYGRSSGYCVDPVEKKPLNHFLPGSAVLSFGTAGCNLGCRFCQNWDISKSREIDTLADEAAPSAVARAAARLGCRSVAFTYNDPVIFLEYAIDVADACHQAGIKAVAVTAGYVCAEPRAEIFRHIDAANVDLKGFTGDFYRRVCLASLDPVLETLLYLRHETGVWVAGQLGPDVPVHFTAFHPDFKMLDRSPTPAATLARARHIALDNGLRYAYTGNVHDPAGQSTRCHQCGALLIERDWYRLGTWRLTADGRCATCDAPLAGVFDGPPGTLGAKAAASTDREPVTVATSRNASDFSAGLRIADSALRLFSNVSRRAAHRSPVAPPSPVRNSIPVGAALRPSPCSVDSRGWAQKQCEARRTSDSASPLEARPDTAAFAAPQ